MRRTLTLLGAAAGLGYVAARYEAGRIRRLPDRYPEERLRRQPPGEEVSILRPDGTRIRAITAGHGPATVVVAHGYGASVREWTIVWGSLLEAGYRVIGYDQRGHGYSTIGTAGIGPSQMAGDAMGVLEHFDVADGILVGHSMGGFLALRCLLDHPECQQRLQGLVLVASFAGRVTQGAPQNRLQIPLIVSGILPALAATETFGTIFGASLAGEHPSPAEIRVFLDDFISNNHRRLVPILQALVSEDLYPRLGEIMIRTIVLCGTEDRTTPPWHSEELARRIPDAELVWVEGAGHMLNYEAPDRIVAAVRSLAPHLEAVR